MTDSVKTTSTALAALTLGWAFIALPARAESHTETAAPKLERVAATVLGVEDLDTAVAFYTSTLGMSVVRTATTDTYDEAILATADTDGTKVVLYESLAEPAEPSPSSRVVFYTSDARSLVEAFRTAGLDIVREATPIAEGSPIRIGIVKDADGHTLEFIQRN